MFLVWGTVSAILDTKILCPCWPKISDILTCHQHVADLLPIFPAKPLVLLSGVGGGRIGFSEEYCVGVNPDASIAPGAQCITSEHCKSTNPFIGFGCCSNNDDGLPHTCRTDVMQFDPAVPNSPHGPRRHVNHH